MKNQGESGQAMTEYLLLVVLLALAVIGICTLFPEAIRGYLQPIYYSVSRPIP